MTWQIVGSVLYGADEFITQFVNARIKNGQFGSASIPCVALGVVRGDKIIGGIVYFNNHGHSIEAAMAFDRSDWARPSTLRRLFAYPYHQVGAARCTAITARSNKSMRKFLEGIGFKVEGVLRKGADGREDAILYGLLRKDIAWLMEPKTHEHTAASSAA